MRLAPLEADVLVAGGLAGVCAAIAAARNGAKVVVAQDRSRLGGNSSSEVKMHVVGANQLRHMPFTPPPWARKITREQLVHRKIDSREYGYWWIEWGGAIIA